MVTQQFLANSLIQISERGRSAFYEGEIAEKLINSTNGWFSHEDLLQHHTRVSAPLTVSYRDFYVHGQPPPSQGMILLEELKIVEGFNLTNLSESEQIHLMVEAKKLAFEDRYRVLGDPEHLEVNVEELLSDEHAAKRRAQISVDKANVQPSKENQEGSDTTYFLASLIVTGKQIGRAHV